MTEEKIMEQDDKYCRLTWMKEEVKNQLKLRDKIVADNDIESLFKLQENSDFSIALHEILITQYEKAPESLTSVELNLFLCMHLENAGQSDSILSFLQEWFPQYSSEVITALSEIDATKSSELIKEAVKLLPEDGGWFFNSADEEKQILMSKIDRDFSNYPDGFLRDLYRIYAERNKNEILNHKY